ncbi:MAG: hypothetical protein ACOY46_17705 [Bacillota bacterium]
MARILFLPVFLIIVALVIFLALRVKRMFGLSKSRDITLLRPVQFEGDIAEIIRETLESLKGMPSVKYQSDILVNFRKINSYCRTGPDSGYHKINEKSKIIEITREKGEVAFKAGKTESRIDSADNPWVYYWCGVNTLEESLRLYYDSGMKVQAGNTGIYLERKYTEIIVLSHALPQPANEAFNKCFSEMTSIYGKNLAEPGISIRNLMVRILVNNLTSMPDYIETKFHIFKDNEFISDYQQNSSFLY